MDAGEAGGTGVGAGAGDAVTGEVPAEEEARGEAGGEAGGEENAAGDGARQGVGEKGGVRVVETVGEVSRHGRGWGVGGGRRGWRWIAHTRFLFFFFLTVLAV